MYATVGLKPSVSTANNMGYGNFAEASATEATTDRRLAEIATGGE